MNPTPDTPCTAFAGHRRLATGRFADVAAAVRADETAAVRSAGGAAAARLVFDDATGAVIEIDPRVPSAAAAGAVLPRDAEPPAAASPAARGRPRLGVVAREVTLLPRHWDWLNAQPGGASVTLRRLVDRERRTGGPAEARRRAQEAAYRAMSVLAGDLPGFEEAARALFAADPQRLAAQVAHWPVDVRDYVLRLAQPVAAPAA